MKTGCSSNYRNPPHLRFDAFRIDAAGQINDAFFDSGFWFQDRRKYAIDRAYVGYHLSERSAVQLGAPFKPFGLMPYPQFGWSYAAFRFTSALASTPGWAPNTNINMTIGPSTPPTTRA